MRGTMIRTLRSGIAALACACAGLCFSGRAQEPLVISDVTVIFGSEDSRAAQTVVIDGERIQWVGQADAAVVPEGARVIDGQGKYLIPGLWDMHVHATAMPGFAPLYIANGVTGVRDMFGMFGAMPTQRVRDAILAGDAVGPHIVATGRIVDGPNPIWPMSRVAGDAEEGRAAVAALADAGADFVKVYSKLPRDAYVAILEEAAERGIPVDGHVPRGVGADEASRLGQRSIEHLTGVLEACAAAPRLGGEHSRAERTLHLVDKFDPQRGEKLFDVFVENRTWHCPTLTVLRAIASLDDAAFTDDERVRYMDPSWTGRWDPRADGRFRSFEREDWQAEKKRYALYLEVVGQMHARGVRLLAGTDVGNPYCFPGFSLHDELGLLVEAGLTPAEALATATRNPAEFLGMAGELGTVEAGKIASLVLLDGDPLADVGNTRRITAVVFRGRLFDRQALDAEIELLDRGPR